MTESFFQFPNDPTAILEILELKSPDWRFEYHQECSSTQLIAKAAFNRGLRDKTAFLVRNQTSGRGRKKRVWISSNQGLDLAMTLLIPISERMENVAIMSLAGGISVAEVLNEITGNDFRVKWPNDIYCQDSKICGILSELLVDGSERAVSMGIGINVNSRVDDFKQDDFMYRVGTVSSITGTEIDMIGLVVGILDRIDANVQLLETLRVGELLGKWDSIGWMANRKIKFRELSGDWESGIIDGINEDGHLVIRDIDGNYMRTLIEGDVIPDDK